MSALPTCGEAAPSPEGTAPAAQRGAAAEAGAGQGRPDERRAGAPDSAHPERSPREPQGRTNGAGHHGGAAPGPEERRGLSRAAEGPPPSQRRTQQNGPVLLSGAQARSAEHTQQQQPFCWVSSHRISGKLRGSESAQAGRSEGAPAICLDTRTCNLRSIYVRSNNLRASFFQFPENIYL